MAELPEGNPPSPSLAPKLTLIPRSVKLPEDIETELPYMAVYYHKTTVSDLIREWIVDNAGATMNKASYQKFRAQLKKLPERGRR